MCDYVDCQQRKYRNTIRIKHKCVSFLVQKATRVHSKCFGVCLLHYVWSALLCIWMNSCGFWFKLFVAWSELDLGPWVWTHPVISQTHKCARGHTQSEVTQLRWESERQCSCKRFGLTVWETNFRWAVIYFPVSKAEWWLVRVLGQLPRWRPTDPDHFRGGCSCGSHFSARIGSYQLYSSWFGRLRATSVDQAKHYPHPFLGWCIQSC